MNALATNGLPAKLLSLDPSSACTGYAVLFNGRLVDCGKLNPVRRRDIANDRIDAMVAELPALISEHRPDLVILEDTSGKVGRRHGAGGGAGLAIHGKAVGAIRQACRELVGSDRVKAVAENVWTRGTPKEKRRQQIAHLFSSDGYDINQDKGGDVADAIGLAQWFVAASRIQPKLMEAA